MTAWGHGSFDNDDALDFLEDLEASRNMVVVDVALAGVMDEEVERPGAAECSRALAAAEVVAALSGKPSNDLPEEIAVWVDGKPPADATLRGKALAAVWAVLGESELNQLWAESDSHDAWKAGVEELASRLN